MPLGGRVNCRDEGGGEVFGEGGQAVGGDRRQEQGVQSSLKCFKTYCAVKVLRNQATFLGNKLEMFANTYLGLE